MRRYYYIDDEVDTIKSIADGINEYGLVKVDVFPLSEYKEFDKLTSKLRSEWKEIDGLILDLKLNGGGVDSTKFTATSLAQWITSFVVTERKEAKPIILLSNDLECVRFEADVTSHDLFDLVLVRSEIKWDCFATVLAVLAEGFDYMNHDKEKSLFSFLRNESIDTTSTYFASFLDKATFNVDQFASFVLNDLFTHPGLLISEHLLAARFGVDIVKSGDNWKRFKEEHLSNAQYKGVFWQIAECYWSRIAEDLFAKLSGGKNASSMTTSQRVAALKACLGEEIGLVAYEPADKNISTYCWTIDEVTKTPLDSSEGYMIQEEGGLKPWQEPRFLSFDTLESGNKGDYHLVPSEQIRFDGDLEAII